MPSRRDFIKASTATGALFYVSSRFGTIPVKAQGPGGLLPPLDLPKFTTPLVIPPPMPRTVLPSVPKTVDYYEIAVRQLTQQVLPAGYPRTTVWGYGAPSHPATFNYPSFTIEATVNRPTRVKWINQLVNPSGGFLPHLLPVDPTLHWANPPGGAAGRDTRPQFAVTPPAYTGPVPLVTHVHGAHTTEDSDGFPEAWFLPAANNIPAGYATVGSWYDTFKAQAQSRIGHRWDRGSAVFQYPNDQAATTLWYHDHSLGLTRLNVYAGPAGFYLLRGGSFDLPAGVLPGPAPAFGDAPGKAYYELPIVIQDRLFNADGSLFYPDSRTFFGDVPAGGPFVPDTDVSPIWNPEFFGNTMVVNGNTWPTLAVEPRRYRLRLLNGCDSRFLILQLENNLPFWQIGAEGGFLPAPIMQPQLLMAPAERADVIVDFTGMPVGTTITLLNLGPDEPFGGGMPGVDFVAADPGTTGQVMRFEIVPLASVDTSVPPQQLGALPVEPANPPTGVVRQLSLNEMMSMFGFDAPVGAMLGVVRTDPVTNAPVGVHKMWSEPITEHMPLGATEVWELYNFTADAHPIHVHQVQFEVVDRQVIGDPIARPPEAWEAGRKDTIVAYPGEITRLKAKFDIPGKFVWHCHIIEHEDNEMMRPFRVGQRKGLVLAMNFDDGTARDSSGLDNHGAVTGAAPAPGKYGGGLQFDGVGALVKVLDAPSLDLQQMTLEAWILSTGGAGWRNLLLKQLSNNPSYGLSYALYANADSEGGAAAYIRPSGWSADQHVAGAALALNTWQHVAATYDQSRLRLYLNGVLVATQAVSTAITTSNLPLYIGGNPLWGEFFAGTLDDLRIYNRALTDAEIREDMMTPVD